MAAPWTFVPQSKPHTFVRWVLVLLAPRQSHERAGRIVPAWLIAGMASCANLTLDGSCRCLTHRRLTPYALDGLRATPACESCAGCAGLSALHAPPSAYAVHQKINMARYSDMDIPNAEKYEGMVFLVITNLVPLKL